MIMLMQFSTERDIIVGSINHLHSLLVKTLWYVKSNKNQMKFEKFSLSRFSLDSMLNIVGCEENLSKKIRNTFYLLQADAPISGHMVEYVLSEDILHFG